MALQLGHIAGSLVPAVVFDMMNADSPSVMSLSLVVDCEYCDRSAACNFSLRAGTVLSELLALASPSSP